MPRFVKQPHENTCGPTAVINAAKWAGVDLSIKHDYKWLMGLCETDLQVGTYPHGIERGLRLTIGICGVKVTRKRLGFGSIRNLEKHLDNGGAIVACTIDHVFLITDQTDKMFVVQNYSDGKATKRIRKTTALMELEWANIWFLKWGK